MDIEIRDLEDHERAAAGAVVGRALATSPTSYWTYGDDALARVRGNLDTFVGFVPAMAGPQVAAFAGAHVVGLAAAGPADQCFVAALPPSEDPDAPPPPVGDPGRLFALLARWALHDPAERHVHVGPVGVDPALQGLGIGSLMLRALCERLDVDGEVGWLETDKPENVVFYRRVGFEVAVEEDFEGLHTWWMRRDPR